MKEYILKNKKSVKNQEIALGILLVGFILGFIFQAIKIDSNGVSVNNFGIIWAEGYVAFIVLGVICEWCFRRYGSSVDKVVY